MQIRNIDVAHPGRARRGVARRDLTWRGLAWVRRTAAMRLVTSAVRKRKSLIAIPDRGEQIRCIVELGGNDVDHLSLTLNLAINNQQAG